MMQPTYNTEVYATIQAKNDMRLVKTKMKHNIMHFYVIYCQISSFRLFCLAPCFFPSIIFVVFHFLFVISVLYFV